MLGSTRRRSCTARKADGSPCGSNPMVDELFCYFHIPITSRRRPTHDGSAATGAAARRRWRAPMTSTGFRSVDGIFRFVEVGAIDLLGLDASVARSNAMFRGALVAARLLETGDLAQRIAVLEAAFATRQPDSPSPFDGDLPESTSLRSRPPSEFEQKTTR